MKSRQSKQNNLLPPSPTRLSSRSVSATEENKIFVGGGGGDATFRGIFVLPFLPVLQADGLWPKHVSSALL